MRILNKEELQNQAGISLREFLKNLGESILLLRNIGTSIIFDFYRGNCLSAKNNLRVFLKRSFTFSHRRAIFKNLRKSVMNGENHVVALLDEIEASKNH